MFGACMSVYLRGRGACLPMRLLDVSSIGACLQGIHVVKKMAP